MLQKKDLSQQQQQHQQQHFEPFTDPNGSANATICDTKQGVKVKNLKKFANLLG